MKHDIFDVWDDYINWMWLKNEGIKPIDEFWEEFKVNKDNDKCDIIDIANEEMKNIDSSKIDDEFKKVFTSQSTQNLIDLIADEKCTDKDLNIYLELLNNKKILELRISDKSLYVKTAKKITLNYLSFILRIEERCIEKVPIRSAYNFYRIDCSKYSTPKEAPVESIYNPEDLVDILMDIGGDCIEEDLLATGKLFDLIKKAFNENWEDMTEEDVITVEIEDKVVAIAINRFISDAKEILSEALFLNPKLFIEVSTPLGTVLLIDTKRWYLDPDFGDSEWFQ